MADLGTDLMLVCSSVSPQAIDDDSLAAQQLSVLAEGAQARGMRIAYEALAWGRHVSTWDRSWRIVDLADHPALGPCLDSFHALSREVGPAGIADITGKGALPPVGRCTAPEHGRAAVQPAPPVVSRVRARST
jgi:4-hydroxyphenylpyruvate dioxygenase